MSSNTPPPVSSSSDSTPDDGLSYRSAGVDIDAGNALIERIKPFAKRTQRPGVMGGLGGFGGLFEIDIEKYPKPILVSGTDGVGTKLRLAIDLNLHDSIGIDLVAMCVNDIIVVGAEPLYFLDYYATGQLKLDVASAVVDGIAKGCELAGAALIGGETAEMPGMYDAEDYDLAGFAVGIANKDALIDGSMVSEGDLLIGLPSSGPHSNGYSLIRKVIQHAGANLNDDFADSTLGRTLLTPTQIYVKSLLATLATTPIHAMAHITGGGLPENLPRVLPAGCAARIHRDAWEMPAIFGWLQEQGRIADAEMLRTFNCGIGMVLVCRADDGDAVINTLAAHGAPGALRLGEIIRAEPNSERVVWA